MVELVAKATMSDEESSRRHNSDSGLDPGVRKAIVAEKIVPVLISPPIPISATAACSHFLADGFSHPDEHEKRATPSRAKGKRVNASTMTRSVIVLRLQNHGDVRDASTISR